MSSARSSAQEEARSKEAKTKIKSTFSVLYSHAIRYEWLTFNPISKVRISSKRLREKDVLNPEEFQLLVEQLSVRDRAMVLLAGSTGLRRSEMIALTWKDVNTQTLEVHVLRSCVRNRFGNTKAESSRSASPFGAKCTSDMARRIALQNGCGLPLSVYPAERCKAGVAAGTGIAVLAVNVLTWLWGV